MKRFDLSLLFSGLALGLCVACGPSDDAPLFEPGPSAEGVDATDPGAGSADSAKPSANEEPSADDAPVAPAPQDSEKPQDDGLDEEPVAQPPGEGTEPDTEGEADPISKECPYVEVLVSEQGWLNVRPDPSTEHEPVAVLKDGEVLDMVRAVEGEEVEGESTWYEVRAHEFSGYVTAQYVACTTKKPAAVPAEF